jgi:hypothetical protein
MFCRSMLNCVNALEGHIPPTESAALMVAEEKPRPDTCKTPSISQPRSLLFNYSIRSLYLLSLLLIQHGHSNYIIFSLLLVLSSLSSSFVTRSSFILPHTFALLHFNISIPTYNFQFPISNFQFPISNFLKYFLYFFESSFSYIIFYLTVAEFAIYFKFNFI